MKINEHQWTSMNNIVQPTAGESSDSMGVEQAMDNHHSDSWNIPSESIRWPRFLKHCSHNQYNYRCTQNKSKVISKPLSRIACAGCQHCWTVGNWPEETTRKNARRTVGSAAMETDGRLPVRVVVVFSQGEVELWDTVWKVDKLRLGCSWHGIAA